MEVSGNHLQTQAMNDSHKHRLSHMVTGGMAFVAMQIFVEKELTEERELIFDMGDNTTRARAWN